MGTYIGACCVYIVFIAQSFQKVINAQLDVTWDIRLYIAVVVLPCIVLGEIRQLKYLIPFSGLANLCIVITFGITLYYIAIGPMHFAARPLFSSWEQLPLFFRYVKRLKRFDFIFSGLYSSIINLHIEYFFIWQHGNFRYGRYRCCDAR